MGNYISPIIQSPMSDGFRRNLIIAARFGEGPESGAERAIAKLPVRS
jgi:hypothetical protein